MAITLNDNLKINAGKPVDSKYLSTDNIPYSAITHANTSIAISERYIGLTVNVDNLEYWYATGVTNSDLILKSSSFSGGTTSGERIERVTTQATHGFALGDVIGYSGGTYVKALATSTFDGEILGIVTEVLDANRFRLVYAGYVSGLNSLSLVSGDTYFASATVAGELTNNEPLGENEVSKPMLTMIDNDTGIVFQHRGFLSISGTAAGGGSGSFTGVTDFSNVGDGTGVYKEIIGDTAVLRSLRGTGSTSTFIDNDTIYFSGLTYSGNNGLSGSTSTNGVIRLGGSLSQNTNITQGSNNFIISNNSTASGSTGVTIMGGSNIILTGSSYSGFTFVGDLGIFNQPTQGNSQTILSWNPSTKKVESTTAITNSYITQEVIEFSGLTTLDFENEYLKIWNGNKSTGFTGVTYVNFPVGATGVITIKKITSSDLNITFPSGTISNAGVDWNSATRTLTLSGALDSYHELSVNQTESGVYKLNYSGEYE